MKIVVLFASLLVIVLSKEDLEGIEQYLQDPKFWHFVEKRLGSKSELESKAPESPSNLKDQYDPFRTGSSNDVSKLKPPYDPFETHSSNDISDKSPDHRPDPMDSEDPLGNLCQYRPNASMIIRSKASLNNGAFFLKSFVKRNREECVNACCDTPRCNLVVYEEKVGMDQDEHNCYLFNCGTPSKCLFAEHANYTSLFFPNHVAPSTSYVGHQQQHENELEDLNSNVAPKPTTRAPRRKVPLYGNCDIDWNDECSDKNAECRDSICKCSYGYHAQYGICRVDCPDNAFECKNKGQGGSVPECISKNHVCDGTPQCADGSDEDSCVNTASTSTTTTTTSSTTTTTTTTPKPVTIKSSQQKVKNVGMNDQTISQYGPINPNRIPVGSDMYNGNNYYWPSGYNQMYGSQTFPRTYSRFQPGAQYPYDPRYYNPYDSTGQQMGGYVDPAGYYDKLAAGAKNQVSGSRTGSDIGKGKGSKPDHSGVKYLNGNVASISHGRDGKPVKSNNDKSVSNIEQKHVVKTTQKPTTYSPTTQPAITRERFSHWRSQQAAREEKTNKHVSGWRGNADKSSQKQSSHDIPSWQSQEGTKKSAQESQSNWEKEQDLSHNGKYNQFKDNSDQSVGTSEHGVSSNVNTHNSQSEESSAGKSQKQDVPVPQHEEEKSWKEHTESHMDNNNYSSGGRKKGTNGNHGKDSRGRMSDGSPGEGRSGSDGSPGEGRSGSDGSPGEGRYGSDGSPGEGRSGSDGSPGEGRSGSDGSPGEGRSGSDGSPGEGRYGSDGSSGEGRSGNGGSPSEGRSGNGESQDRPSGRHRGQGKSDRWQQHQRWKDGGNKKMGQTNDRQKGEANTNDRIQKQDRTRVGSKVRTGNKSHRKQSIIGQGSNRLTDTPGKSSKGKHKGNSESMDYGSYFNKSPQTGQKVVPKKQGYRRPAYKNQRPHQYQYYDSYRPSPYWNYDYYDYNDPPNKKYPSPYDQGDSDNDQDWTDNNANEKNIPPVIDETPTPKATQKPTPKPPQITTRAPGIKEIKNKDPGQTSKEKSAPGGDNPEKNTDKKQQASSEKSKDTLTLKTNSTESKVPDSSGLLEEAVETHVVVESPTDSHQGPIVALALGLGITVILLFFVGCRLRNVKRRIRKGRALHSNEADYLINGMYL